MTFPAGIVRVFSATPPPPVLSFRLVHTSAIEHYQPNADLLFRYSRKSGGQRQGGPEAGGGQELPAWDALPCLLGSATWPWANQPPSRTSLFFPSSLPTHLPTYPSHLPTPRPRGTCLTGPKVDLGMCTCRKP